MNCLDFKTSSIGWKLKNGSLGLFTIDSSLKEKKNKQTNYLANTVIAGNVYGKSILPIVPNYNFQWLTNGKNQVIFRSFSNNKIKIDTRKSYKVDKFILNIKRTQKIEISIHDLFNDYSLFNMSLICIIDLSDQIIEFPIKHININPLTKEFQVETGPLLFKKSNKFISAFIFFNSNNKFQIVWYYPKLGGKIEELELKLRYFIDA